MSTTLRAGFVPLVDAAPLVAATERGFAAAEGIELQPVRQASWASLRDHLILGYTDCAQALAPLPIAAALGVGQVRTDIVVPFVLSRGGNAITLSHVLVDEITAANGGRRPEHARAWARALAITLRGRAEPVTLAMVYPFSGHNFEIRYRLAAAGIHPDRDVRLVAIPPPLMVESLRAGQVDGFCVGEPWNSLAVASGLGEIVATKSDVFRRGIEKVLAMPSQLAAEVSTTTALIRALAFATEWCDEPRHHADIAELLARPEYLGTDPEASFKALSGRLPFTKRAHAPTFLFLSRFDANRPRREEALWIHAQMRRWGQIPADPAAEAVAARVFRPDIYAHALGAARWVGSHPIEACDGVEFDGKSVSAYLECFDLATPYGTQFSDL
jgi:ABC-type nitrate/sulfonate/bicarbonate transport system substrate-binding protein